jgi:hypothetical protein
MDEELNLFSPLQNSYHGGHKISMLLVLIIWVK